MCIQVVTVSLRCVSWLIKFPLPSLNRCVPTIGKLLFNLLKNYAKAGAKVGENFEMVLSAFKVNEILLLVLFTSSVMSLTKHYLGLHDLFTQTEKYDYYHPQAMTVIIRNFKQYTVAEKHLQVLLGFVEEDIHDHTKQGTAFPLLKVGSLLSFCKRR